MPSTEVGSRRLIRAARQEMATATPVWLQNRARVLKMLGYPAGRGQRMLSISRPGT